jgi:hypothetical protein
MNWACSVMASLPQTNLSTKSNHNLYILMKYPFFVVLLSLLTSVSCAESWNGTASIQFEGTSTLHDWGGKVDAEPFKAEVAMLSGKPQSVVSKIVVKAAKMDTADAKRDENMRKAMKAPEHPLIQAFIDAKFTEIAVAGTPQKLPFTLTLLGKPQNLTGTISNWRLSGNKATFDLECDLSLKKSGITVPSVLLFIKVGDTIKIHASVTLTRP